MEIPLRYSIFFAGSHWKVDSSQGKAAPTSLFDLWVYLDLGSGGLSCTPVWGRRSRPAALQPQVLLPWGCRRGPHCPLPQGGCPAWARTWAVTGQGGKILLLRVQSAGVDGFSL